MTNAELIKALRYCAEHECCDESVLAECKYSHKWKEGEDCNAMLLADAADALEAADKRIEELSLDCEMFQQKCMELGAQIPKEGEWLRTDAFPHRVYCSCCYKTYVPNENWQIWQDDADNFGLPRNYCPNCGAMMKNVTDCHTLEESEQHGES